MTSEQEKLEELLEDEASKKWMSLVRHTPSRWELLQVASNLLVPLLPRIYENKSFQPKDIAQYLLSMAEELGVAYHDLRYLGNVMIRGAPARISEAISADALICLECGRKMRRMSCHLKRTHHMTWDSYLFKWNLPQDFPRVCEDTMKNIRKNKHNLPAFKNTL